MHRIQHRQIDGNRSQSHDAREERPRRDAPRFGSTQQVPFAFARVVTWNKVKKTRNVHRARETGCARSLPPSFLSTFSLAHAFACSLSLSVFLVLTLSLCLSCSPRVSPLSLGRQGKRLCSRMLSSTRRGEVQCVQFDKVRCGEVRRAE